MRAWDLKQMNYLKDSKSPWQIGVNPINNKLSVSIPLENGGYCTTAHIMRFVSDVLYIENDKTIKSDLYENDIVEVSFYKGLKTYGDKGDIITKIAEVVYCEDYGSFILQWEYNKHQHHITLSDFWIGIKVLGNKYQNPEIELSDGNCWQ